MALRRGGDARVAKIAQPEKFGASATTGRNQEVQRNARYGLILGMMPDQMKRCRVRERLV